MDELQFFVDITDADGDAYGSGPLTSVTSWRYTARIDRAGTIDFDFSASDPQAAHVQNKRRARARALLGDSWQWVGGGVIDNIATVPDANGNVIQRASGLDLIGLLNTRNTRRLEIGAESGATLNQALTIMLDLTPPSLWGGWSIDSSVPSDYFYAKFDGESFLGAIIYIAEKTQTHFYQDIFEDLFLVFTADFEDSGIRAIQAEGELSDNTCAITSLTRTVDTHDLLTRIYPYGSGEDRESSLTLSATARTAPAGYTLDKEENFIENDVATATFGLIDFPEFQFKEIDTISNTDADYEAASDFLFDCALAELQKRSTLAAQYTYDISVAGCRTRLRPAQMIRLVYSDPLQGININQDLYILAATTQWDTTGIQTTQLKVSTHPVWPKSSEDNAAERSVQGRVFQKHPQISLNEWWENATLILGHDQTDHVAEFPFRLGRSVVMVKQVVFQFKLERVLAAGNAYRLSDDETALNALADTGDTEAIIEDTAVVIDVASTAITTTATTINNETVTINTTAAGIAAVAVDVDMGAVTVNNVGVTVVDNSATGIPITINVNPQIDTTFEIPPATLTNHYHTLTHGHPADLPQHTHPLGSEHAHAAVDHDHTTQDHAHTSPAHGHTANAHNHTSPAHGHLASDHAHTSPDHDHTSPEHHHSSPQHIHDVPELLATFEITRALASRTYAMDELEYAVNGGGWVDLDTATSAGDDYFQLDITVDVTSPTIPFRPAQTNGNNVVEVRRKGGGSLTITDIAPAAPTAYITTSAAHGLIVGEQVRISGTTNYNGVYVVTEVTAGTVFGITHTSTLTESSGTVIPDKSAQLLCKLGVRTVIGAVAFVT